MFEGYVELQAGEFKPYKGWLVMWRRKFFRVYRQEAGRLRFKGMMRGEDGGCIVREIDVNNDRWVFMVREDLAQEMDIISNSKLNSK